jgi:hypothetical protein
MNTVKLKLRRGLIAGALLLVMNATLTGVLQASGLTALETYWLTCMRQEEKLARDVYLYLEERYGARIFTNISASEQRHMDAIKNLLVRYGIPDPVGQNSNPPGQDVEGLFVDPDLQALYDELIVQGSLSLVDALEVGVLIEEKDINDLQEAIRSTKRRDLKNVYGNLLQGSFNHLDAFNTNLRR